MLQCGELIYYKSSRGFTAMTAYEHSPNVHVAKSHPPVTRLPVELLVFIFSMVGPVYSDAEYTNHGDYLSVLRTQPATNMEWVKAMLVCRSWREVGINAPRLWRIISVTRNLESLEYRLRRSIGSTIDVILDDSPYSNVNVDALPLLRANASRIRSIQTQPWFHFMKLSTLKPLFLCKLPALERVDMVPTWSGEVERRFQIWTGNVPSRNRLEYKSDVGLSATRHPHIQHLVIAGVSLPGPSSVWALSILDLSLDFGTGKGQQYSIDILSFLRSAKSLKSLRVVQYTAKRHWPISSCVSKAVLPQVLTPVDLPRLDHICFRTPHIFVTQFFKKTRLHRPLSFTLSIDIPSHTTTSDITQAIDTVTPRVIRESIFTRCNTAWIGRCDEYGFSISDRRPVINVGGDDSSSTESWHPHSTQDDCHFDLQFRIPLGAHPLTSALRTLSRLCGNIALGTLEVLEGFSREDSDDLQEPWLEVFATFPKLHTLSFPCPREAAYDRWNKVVALDSLLTYLRDPAGHGVMALRNLSVDGICVQNTLQMNDALSTVLNILHTRHERAYVKLDSLCLRISHKRHTSDASVRHRINFNMHRGKISAIGSYCGHCEVQIQDDTQYPKDPGVASSDSPADKSLVQGGLATGASDEKWERFKERYDKRSVMIDTGRRLSVWKECMRRMMSPYRPQSS